MTEQYDKVFAAPQFIPALVTFYLPYVFLLAWSPGVVVRVLTATPTKEAEADAILGIESSLLMLAAACGFLGAMSWVLGHLTWRIVRTDVHPRLFAHAAIRLVSTTILAPFLVLGVGITAEISPAHVAILGFGTGLFAQRALRAMESLWDRIITIGRRDATALPLRKIQGLSANDAFRLWEEGIADAQNLAMEGLNTLLVNTTYSLERILDWKDQAMLHIYAPTKIDALRNLHIRGAIDVTGLHPERYDEEKYKRLAKALGEALDEPEAVVDRFVDNLNNDPCVEQLWSYYRAVNQDVPKAAP